MNIYQCPEYYEIAFSFRDLAQEVDFFEEAIWKFSGVTVNSVFELATGTCPYLEEWHKRVYRYFGLDSSREMIWFLRERAKKLTTQLTLFRSDMKKFALGSHRFDLAYILLGSLYVATNDHFSIISTASLEYCVGEVCTCSMVSCASISWPRTKNAGR